MMKKTYPMSCYASTEARLQDMVDDLTFELEECKENLFNKKEIISKLTLGIEEVRALIDESSGVAGLHMNGDIAAWSELESGGRFEEWLSDFNDAELFVEQIRCNEMTRINQETGQYD